MKSHEKIGIMRDIISKNKKNMIKIMISQPMATKTEEEIEETMERIKNKILNPTQNFVENMNEIREITPDTVVYVMNTVAQNYVIKSDLECFADSVKFMSEVDVLLMAKGWQNSRECRTEHKIATEYDLPILYEVDL